MCEFLFKEKLDLSIVPICLPPSKMFILATLTCFSQNKTTEATIFYQKFLHTSQNFLIQMQIVPFLTLDKIVLKYFPEPALV